MITCSRLECKHCSKFKCKCKNLNLSDWGVNTKHMGYKHFLECKNYEESQESIELKNKLIEMGIIKGDYDGKTRNI